MAQLEDTLEPLQDGLDQAQSYLDMTLLKLGDTEVTISLIIAACVVVVISFVLAMLARKGIHRLANRMGDGRRGVMYIIERLSFYIVLVIGLMSGLSVVGIDLTHLSVFAGALGVGIGLGLQGVVKEFVSGLALMFDRSMNVGDFVEINNGLAGEVVEIGTRATRIVTNDKVDIMVPNSNFIEGQLTNWTRGGATRRVRIPFGVAYGSDKETVRKAALEAAASVPFSLPEDDIKKRQVWLVGFGDSALNFELVVWPNLEAVKRPSAMTAAYNWAIEDALRKYNIEIPFPQTDLHLRSFFGTTEKEAIKTLGYKPSRDAAKPAPKSTKKSTNDAAGAVVEEGEREQQQAAELAKNQETPQTE